MGTKQPAKGDGINTCKACGSGDLFDGYFNKQGLAVTGGDPKTKWRTVCNVCGQDQNRAIKKKDKNK